MAQSAQAQAFRMKFQHEYEIFKEAQKKKKEMERVRRAILQRSVQSRIVPVSNLVVHHKRNNTTFQMIP